MLEFAILGLLHEAPMHGYELRKRLFDMLGTLRAFSYGSLYPTLRRLLKAGLIVEDDEREQDGVDERAAARAWGKRAKRVYKLTAEGKERFAEMLADVGPQAYDDEGFGVHMAFFSRTPAEVRMRILEGRRRRVEERREGLRSSVARAGEQIDRYTRELHRLGLEHSEREVRWLNELIATEQREQKERQDGVE
ncbi:PadR family transcriptional regulator [Actinophytocola sp. NPDC049390]|uniref:PadR family transcriptional regulator n=1 Tax=Actinophytocola sp. NPDC049390 TaxID=3363894 RepID=UPI00378C675F